MKTIGWVIIGLLFTGNVFPQQVETSGNVSVCVVVPESSEYLTSLQLNRLQTKLEQIAIVNGVAALSNSCFVVYPVFEVNESKLIEGGLKNVVKTNADLTLFIRQLDSHLIINSVSMNLHGTGLSKDESIINALLSVNPQDASLKSFIAEGKRRIIQYYKENYTNIKTKAKALAGLQQYEAALTLLMSYPEELPEYESIINDALIIYTQYINNKCSRLLLDAKGLVAVNDYDDAISLLYQIDPSSKCSKEASALILSIQKEIDTEVAFEKKLVQQKLQTQIELEKRRIDAIKEVAKAYASSQPQIYYKQIVKY